MEVKLDKTTSILNKSSIVLFEWDVEAEVTLNFVSDSIGAFGYTPEDFYTGEFAEFWPFIYEADREKAKRTIHDARMRQQKEIRHNYRVICKSGKVKWVEELVIFEKDHYGEIIKELGVIYDVTKQKQMEEIIARSERKYRNLFEKGPTLLLQLDSDGKIVTVNKAALSVLEYRKHELMGMPLSQLMVEPSENFLVELLKEPSQIPTELSIINKGNQVVTLSVLNHRLDIDDLTREHYLIGQNITQMKANEKQIQYLSYHDQLTGLFNANYFDAYLKQLNEETGRHYAVVLGQLYQLKKTCELFGQKLGEELVLAVTEILKNSCRQTDIVCRVDEDLFAMILPDADDHVAMTVCARVKESCEQCTELLVLPQMSLGYGSKSTVEATIEEVLGQAASRQQTSMNEIVQPLRSDKLISLKDRLEDKTLESSEHCKRIQQYSVALARKLGLSDSQIDQVSLASYFHDVGRMGVASEVLLKQGALTDDEWTLMQQHSEFGYNVLISCGNVDEMALAVRHHHEHWDGTGYPDGLKGLEIPLVSRIIALADAYDVMTNDRVYSRSMTKHEAIEEIIRCKGSQFDPTLVDAFIHCLTYFLA